jgi:hypothetical protein
MGLGESTEAVQSQKIVELFSHGGKEGLEARAKTFINSIDNPDELRTLTLPTLSPDSVTTFHCLLATLIQDIHQRAVATNAAYANPKQEGTPPACGSAVTLRLLLLDRLLRAAMAQSQPIADYLWKTNGSVNVGMVDRAEQEDSTDDQVGRECVCVPVCT